MTCRRGAFHRAYQKGLEAAVALPQVRRDRNPYPDHRGGEHGQVITYSRAWANAWDAGWAAGDRVMREVRDAAGVMAAIRAGARSLEEAVAPWDEYPGGAA